MNQTNQFPSYDSSFSYLCSSALGLVDKGQQFGTIEQQPIYQGIPVQVLNPIPIYNSGPDTCQNEANHSNSLNTYNIESLTNFNSENVSGTDLQEIPQSILDQYVPYQPDYEPVNDALLLTPGTPFQQLISWDELEIREQTTANHTSSGLQLTDLPAGIHSSQDLRPVAVVNPLCMHQATSDNQTTQAEVNVDGSSSLAERKRERQRERRRELRKDPAYAERDRERKRERERERYQTDPAYAKRKRERERERQRERFQTDPAYAERKRERERERQRERYQRDPTYAERARERRRKRHKERCQTESAYVERERERQKKYRQSVNSAKNSGVLPLTSNLAETNQSSSKNSEGTTAPPAFQSSS